RRVEDWIASRYLHRGGAYARSIAAAMGVPLGALGDIWAADWDAHLAGARMTATPILVFWVLLILFITPQCVILIID
ncbi:MAG: hypothetical protein MEQ74_15550, partial [Paracoccus sp.]|nr:hypothetical protein [Paracoccus sp. (in: a-proteobacteria)]